MSSNNNEVFLILGNSNKNFSGVTSTMLRVADEQKKLVNLRIMGKHHLEDKDLYISFMDTVKLCRKPLADGKYRIFHARRVDEMIQALLLRYLFGSKIKIVFSSAAQRKRSWLTTWITQKMDAVIAVSRYSAEYLEESPDKIIPHGVSTEIYKPPTDRSEAWMKLGYGGKIGIGILGRVRKQKGVHKFVDACISTLPEHPDVTAIIVGPIAPGHQNFVDELKNKINATGLSDRIIFTGEVPFEQIPVIFRSLFLVAALSDNEGFGLTVLEAMSSGAAVVSSKAGAWTEIIRDGEDGFILPENTSEELTEKLDLLLKDPSLMHQMGLNGRERIMNNYSIKKEAEGLIDIFKSLS